ncbi:MAG: hypothetical protein ABH814_01025 [bacterium]
MPTAVKTTTQNHLDIETIRDGLVILKDGGVRLLLTVSAVNFDLLSEREQDAAIDAYGSLLNSLSFQVQILIKSKRMDISQYLNWLSSEKTKQPSQKRIAEIKEYEEYIKQIVAKNDVLDKKFFVTIPYNSVSIKPKQSPVDWLRNREPQPKFLMPQKTLVKKALLELEPKRDHLIKQFARIGIGARQMQNQELVELFYAAYNPQISRFQKIGDPSDRERVMVQGKI